MLDSVYRINFKINYILKNTYLHQHLYITLYSTAP